MEMDRKAIKGNRTSRRLMIVGAFSALFYFVPVLLPIPSAGAASNVAVVIVTQK